MGAICKDCKGDMLKVDGCIRLVIECEGKTYERIKVGGDGDFFEGDINARCGDCNAKHNGNRNDRRIVQIFINQHGNGASRQDHDIANGKIQAAGEHKHSDAEGNKAKHGNLLQYCDDVPDLKKTRVY